MSESVVADFTGRVGSRTEAGEPARCRVVMNGQQVAIATEDHRRTVPLASVFDVVVGRPPSDVREFFDDAVTIAYREEGERKSVTVLAEADRIDRFTTVLFRALLSGTEALVRYRARAGGRVTDDDAVHSTLGLGDRTVEFRREDDVVTIDVEAVVDFDRTERELAGSRRPIISVRHVDSRDAVTSEVALPSERKLNVLGRYLRLVYSHLVEDLADLELTNDEAEVLAARYTSGGEVNLASVLGTDAARTDMLLDSLVEKGLLADNEHRSFTSRGLLVVNRRLESIN